MAQAQGGRGGSPALPFESFDDFVDLVSATVATPSDAGLAKDLGRRFIVAGYDENELVADASRAIREMRMLTAPDPLLIAALAERCEALDRTVEAVRALADFASMKLNSPEQRRWNGFAAALSVRECRQYLRTHGAFVASPLELQLKPLLDQYARDLDEWRDVVQNAAGSVDELEAAYGKSPGGFPLNAAYTLIIKLVNALGMQTARAASREVSRFVNGLGLCDLSPRDRSARGRFKWPRRTRGPYTPRRVEKIHYDWHDRLAALARFPQVSDELLELLGITPSFAHLRMSARGEVIRPVKRGR